MPLTAMATGDQTLRGLLRRLRRLVGLRIGKPILERFSGSFEDGRTFEIQIQALAEEYLR